MRELPNIGSSSYATSAVNALSVDAPVSMTMVPRRVSAGGPFVDVLRENMAQRLEEKQMAAATRRLVQVVIADPDPRIPNDRALLFKGEEQLTDLTNEELFYELDIKGILTKHNEYRTTVADKTVKDRTELLEPARVRDLKMVVVEIAKF